ncbi:Wadjet anti-phage system protein JetD domain-containing protein [Neobacillus dielmonensis]|uniref:Wadjet anti-phage system protein JetD domain-containing protein n=1 Tax=Neobacillus dielmonensis TaxID=1347369 RepID=UPI0005A89D76|nr:Wadjet anti-phage system protein JetD domain-containing protein [Neobacillus dielmonensis]
MKDKMKTWLQEYLKALQLPTKRKKIHIQQLENYLIKDKLKEPIRYQAENGYRYFVQIMNELTEEGIVTPVKKSPLNGRRPSLHTEWWLEKAVLATQWSDTQIMAVSNLMNLSKYRQHPEWQTVQEWKRIEILYSFLKQIEQYTWVTREERSFQLFREEKFLANEGTGLLQRLQITLDDLKARVYGEPFAFWLAPHGDIRNAKTVLIVENQSFYHTCRLLINRGKDIKGIQPDLVIYGEGKKIEKSFNFLHDITNMEAVTIDYVGDIDPEGWGIYVRLKETYPSANIGLAVSIYEAMLDTYLTNHTEKNQNENRTYLQRVVEDFQQHGRPDLAERIQQLWEEKRRVPQEVLSLDNIGRIKE